MRYIPRETSVSAFRFGKHIPPKWYMGLINRGKAFAAVDNTDKTNPLKLEIQLPTGNVTAVPGDWILLNTEGKISVLSHDEFVSTYREVNDG
jgi:hypothetical protein